MKRFLLGFALALLAACGDDESSFAPRDDEPTSSSSENVTPQSSESEASVSSSSVRSSSSAPVEDLSSSSSAKSSSSIASSSSAKSSSSSAKSSSSTKSSSSVSSSSEYVPYDHLIDMGDGVGTHVKKQDYKTFTDERNGRSYYYLTIRGKNKAGEADSVTVMAENLNIGKMIYYDDYQEDDSKIERFCYNDDTTNCDRYGALYQWAEMMQLPSECNSKSCADLIQPNHQGICPDGWRLLTQDDFYIVLKSENAEHGIEDVRARGFGGYNYTGYSLVGAGYVLNRKLKNIGESAGWFYTEEGVDAPAEGAFVSSTAKTGDIFSTYEMAKTNGLSVRCVKLEE